ncbi:MAG: ferrochelatase [Sandaracinaceae bacterium]
MSREPSPSRARYDAVMVVSFGGPEGPDDVMPFLENVVRGRNVPRARLEAVAEHYHHFGGVSPIGARTRELADALRDELARRGHALPVYVGNRHWHPMLADTLRSMRDDGIERALGFVTSAFSSYSGCRAYREDLAKARGSVGPGAPRVDKIRPFYDHPALVEVWEERLRDARTQLPADRRSDAHVLFTAHSIPLGMARGCDYEAQLEALASLLRERLDFGTAPVVYQSRSGPPQVPWLEPDVNDALRKLAEEHPGAAVIAAPIGFVADHMEVVWDLDHEAEETAKGLGLAFARATAPNAHPRFVQMAAELVEERLDPSRPRPALGPFGVRPDRCVPGCCAPSEGRPRPSPSGP